MVSITVSKALKAMLVLISDVAPGAFFDKSHKPRKSVHCGVSTAPNMRCQ